jgi:histidine ammonia-lyase
MIAQVASASLVSENKILCHPASVDSIPSSAGREDHVSMGSIAARKLQQIIANVRTALAIELLTAAVGLDQRAPLKPSRGVAAAHATLRALVAPLAADRPLYRDIARIADLIATGALVQSVEREVGALK